MKILILEDNDERIEWFKRAYREQMLSRASTIEMAKYYCSLYEFDVIFLDHDLTNRDHEAIENNYTGYEFVKYMIENKIGKHALIYIHSMNPTGANAMLNLLIANGYHAEWLPYHLLKLADRGE